MTWQGRRLLPLTLETASTRPCAGLVEMMDSAGWDTPGSAGSDEMKQWSFRCQTWMSGIRRLGLFGDPSMCQAMLTEFEHWLEGVGKENWRARTVAVEAIDKTFVAGEGIGKLRCSVLNAQARGLVDLLINFQLDSKLAGIGAADLRHSALPSTQEELSVLVRRDAAARLAIEAVGTEDLDAALSDLCSLANRAISASKGVRIAAFGSAVSGLATKGSDVDVVLVGHSGKESKSADEIRAEKGSGTARQQDGSSPLFNKLKMELHLRGKAFRLDAHRTHANVPVLKLTHRPTNTSIDVVCNNVLGVHNSQLLRAYMTFDVLARPLALASIVKQWAKRRDINDSARDTLSSYAYTLMVVFFLQQRGVLPNLQAPGLLSAYEDWRGAKMPAATVNGFEVRYCADDKFLASLARCRVESELLSTESVGSLLLGFFAYYAGVFNWDKHAVSVRLGHPRLREGWEACQPGRMGIEDPFEGERDVCATLGKCGTLRGQGRIFEELDRARKLLHEGLSGAGGAGRAATVLAALLSDDEL